MVSEKSKRESPPDAGPSYTPPEASNTYVDEDLVKELFGEKTTILREDENDVGVPEEIQQFMEMHGLGRERNYRVLLKEIPEGAGAGESQYITSFRNQVPTTDWIAKHYGPGVYVIILQWDNWGADSDGKRRKKTSTERVDIVISEKYRKTYRDFQFKMKITDAQKKKEMVKEAQIDDVLDEAIPFPVLGGKKEGKSDQSPEEYVNKMLDFAQKFGLTQNRGFNWEKVVPLLLTSIPVIVKFLDDKALRERQEQKEFLLAMMSNTQQNTSTLVELIKGTHGPANGTQMMEEMSKMIFSALDIKDALTGKETAVDKIFSMIEKVLPVIMMFASMPKAARESNPTFGMAQNYIQNDPNMQELLKNPQKRNQLIRKLDAHYGWGQTDRILAVMEIERPGDCPRMVNQQFPRGDERNEEQEPQEPRQQEDEPQQAEM